MSSNLAINVENVSKCYMLYERPQDRLMQSIVPRFQRLMGLPPSVYFREFWALRNLTFSVSRGETVGIIGRNGSGKSTLLQIVCGILTPTIGAVSTRGRVAAILELGAGFNPDFTGRENVYMNAAIFGLSNAEIDARFDAIAAFADIGQHLDQPVRSYSSGMYVRLAFAVIAHVDADILIIDEALAVGDVFFTQKCMRFLRKFMGRGTVIFVSHDSSSVVNLCNRAIWLENGQLQGMGAPKEVCEKFLARNYESQQGGHNIKFPTSPIVGAKTIRHNRAATDDRTLTSRDMRQDFINSTCLRNDLQVFAFKPDGKAFGKGGGRITDVAFFDSADVPLAWIVGGEDVCLRITASAGVNMAHPLVGFIVKDRLGQNLFGDNTYLTYMEQGPTAQAGEVLITQFRFRMPILPVGDYTITVALADGTQSDHVQHHWLHDAIAFKSHTSSVSTGLVGVPMTLIEMSVSQSENLPALAPLPPL